VDARIRRASGTLAGPTSTPYLLAILVVAFAFRLGLIFATAPFNRITILAVSRADGPFFILLASYAIAAAFSAARVAVPARHRERKLG
jgi:hypothetical protein